MRRFFTLTLVSFCGTAVVVAVFVANSPLFSFADVERMAASVFFVDSITAEGLREKYANAERSGKKIRVLVVPGHDSVTGGAEFRGVRESDMTVEVGEALVKLLASDTSYEPLLLRAKTGYAPGFLEYVASERANIRAFINEKRKTMKQLESTGTVQPVAGVIHNNAPSDVVEKLYGVNRWANANNADIVLHIHFNDYPGRPYNKPGRYNGFSIYIPDEQFSNARASRAVAGALFSQFSKFYAESNLPIENAGIVPDQKLIAIGAYNTLDSVGVLVEYGYIYEQKFLNDEVRAAFMKELAFQTYQGLNRFFGKGGEIFEKYQTTFLPYEWREPLAPGKVGKNAAALQIALLFDGMYPPEGKDKRDCPLSGSFGSCTAQAVKAFQKQNAITPASGAVGEETITKLNEKYSR